MPKLQTKKYAFTLSEVIIICTIFAVMVVGLILAINRSFVFIDNTRLLVRASNLAREGVEMVYNLRDSNRRKYSGNKDAHRIDASGGTALTEGIYLIKEAKTSSGDSYIFLTGLTVSSITGFYEIDGFFSDTYSGSREESKIIFTGQYKYYSGGSIENGNIEDLVKVNGLDFYRIVRVYGIYNKLQSCSSENCPKEMRFCVKVFYRNSQGQHATELCSIMTNFEK